MLSFDKSVAGAIPAGKYTCTLVKEDKFGEYTELMPGIWQKDNSVAIRFVIKDGAFENFKFTKFCRVLPATKDKEEACFELDNLIRDIHTQWGIATQQESVTLTEMESRQFDMYFGTYFWENTNTGASGTRDDWFASESRLTKAATKDTTPTDSVAVDDDKPF